MLQIKETGITRTDLTAVKDALEHAMAANTNATYRSRLNTLIKWAKGRGVAIKDLTTDLLAVFLSTEGAKRSNSWRVQLVSAVNLAFEDSGLTSPARHTLIKRTMQGLRRQRPDKRQQAAALTEEDANRIIATAMVPRRGRGRGFALESKDTAKARGRLDIAIICVMRDAMLRRSEAAALNWEDLTVMPDGSGRLLIRKSKTDQDGEGHVSYLRPKTVDRLELIRGENSESMFGLGAKTLARRITAMAQAAGLKGNFSGHSCRIGMANDLATRGATLVDLQNVGRWTSPVMPALYTRNQQASLSAVATLFN